jgi:phage terminase large subunit
MEVEIELEVSPAVAEFLRLAELAGCKQEQIEFFLRAGYVPLPWQLEFHGAARLADEPDGPDQMGAGGSRGPGKSHMILAQVALDDCQRLPGLKCLYLRKIAKQAVEQFDDLRRRVLRHVNHKWTAKGMIVFPNGSRIITGHFKDEKDIDAYLGIEYDVIVIEEATTLTSSKYQGLRDSNRTSKPWRPRIYNSTNPGGIGHTWYKNRFVEPHRNNEEKWTRFFPATLDDNTHVDPDYRRKVEENVGWKLRAYRYGDWDIAVGQFFSTWRHHVHVIAPFAIPRDWPVWIGFDYGFIHPTVALVMTRDNDGGVYAIAEHVASRQTVADHCYAIQRMIRGLRFVDADRDGYVLPMAEVWPIAAGSDVFARRGDTSGKTIAEQYADYGIYLTQADIDRVNGAAEVLRRLGDVDNDKVLTPPGLYVFNNCRRLIDCIPAMIHNPTKPEDVLKVDIDEDGSGGDDSFDALRYALMAKGIGGKESHIVVETDSVERYDNLRWGQGADEPREPEAPDLVWHKVYGGAQRG